MPKLPHRKRLPGDVPDWVDDGAVFFFTICAEDRGKPVLTTGNTPSMLTRAVEQHHNDHRWYRHLLVIMPDHAHGLFPIPKQEKMRALCAQGKSDTAKCV